MAIPEYSASDRPVVRFTLLVIVLTEVRTVPVSSGKVIVLVPEVEAPVILKLFVAGVPDVPARNMSLKGKVADPKSSAAAASGNNAVFKATLARLSKAFVAPLAVVKTVPDSSGKVIALVPDVDVPVILKLFVPGVPEEPAK
jgi:hypothetical protein